MGKVCKASSRSRVAKVWLTTALSRGENGNGTTAVSVGLTKHGQAVVGWAILRRPYGF